MDSIAPYSHKLNKIFASMQTAIQEKEIFKKFQALNNESVHHKSEGLKAAINDFTKFEAMLEQSPSVDLIELLKRQLTQVINNLSQQHFKHITHSAYQSLMTAPKETLTNQVELILDLSKTEDSSADKMAIERRAILTACESMQKQLNAISTESVSHFTMFSPLSTRETLTHPDTNHSYTKSKMR